MSPAGFCDEAVGAGTAAEDVGAVGKAAFGGAAGADAAATFNDDGCDG